MTAAWYSSLPSVLFGVGMSSTAFGSVRVSRGGMELRTEARPAPADAIWALAMSAKSES
ncbi:hypothetical protein [Streptomyces longispororuber]|uniref:hypothetical protein n=1 Tax=Streptomyces longispororuber TaxID=68230 RepID=UPI0036F9C611